LMIMNDERIRLGEWKFGDRLRTEKDPVKSQILPGGTSQSRDIANSSARRSTEKAAGHHCIRRK
ncbi:MAG: hypothetical protein WBM44_06325, partial [Waterburya sp.]